MTRLGMLRFSIGRQLIHVGLRIMPSGRVKAELSDLLWEWGDHVRAEVALANMKRRREAVAVKE